MKLNPALFSNLVLLVSCSFFVLFKLQIFSHVFFCGSSVFKALATGLHVGRLRWLGSPWARIRAADPEF